MKKTIIGIIFLFLIGLSFAGLTCNGDITPNQGTILKLNCSTTQGFSACYAFVSTNGTFVSEYPTTCFGEDRICWNTANNGRFATSIPLGSAYYQLNTSYTVEIECVSNTDNSTNSTTFSFIPSNPLPPDWIASGWVYVTNNAGFFVLLLVGLFILAIIVREILERSGIMRKTRFG